MINAPASKAMVEVDPAVIAAEKPKDTACTPLFPFESATDVKYPPSNPVVDNPANIPLSVGSILTRTVSTVLGPEFRMTKLMVAVHTICVTEAGNVMSTNGTLVSVFVNGIKAEDMEVDE